MARTTLRSDIRLLTALISKLRTHYHDGTIVDDDRAPKVVLTDGSHVTGILPKSMIEGIDGTDIGNIGNALIGIDSNSGLVEFLSTDTLYNIFVDLSEAMGRLHTMPSVLGSSNVTSDARVFSSGRAGGMVLGSSGFAEGRLSDPNGDYDVGWFSDGDYVTSTQLSDLTFSTPGLSHKIDTGSTLSVIFNDGTNLTYYSNMNITDTISPSDNGVISYHGSNGRTYPPDLQGDNHYAGIIEVVMDLSNTTLLDFGGFFDVSIVHTESDGVTYHTSNLSSFTYNGDTSGAAIWDIGLNLTDNTRPEPSYSDLVEGSSVYPNFISGVEYYDTGTLLDATVSCEDLYRQTYSDAGLQIDPTNLGDTLIEVDSTAMGGVPYYYDATANTVQSIEIGNGSGEVDATVNVRFIDPFGNAAWSSTPQNGIRVFAFDSTTPRLTIDFQDESRRCINDLASGLAFDDYDTFVSGRLTEGLDPVTWDSTSDITTYDTMDHLIIVPVDGSYRDGVLVYPNHDFSAGLPSGGPDYTLQSGDKYYRSYFAESEKRSWGKITLVGNLSYDDIETSGSPQALIQLRVPEDSASPWRDLGTSYQVDGTGCVVGSPSADSTEISFTLAEASTNNSTFDSSNILQVRVCYYDPDGTSARLTSVGLSDTTITATEACTGVISVDGTNTVEFYGTNGFTYWDSDSTSALGLFAFSFDDYDNSYDYYVQITPVVAAITPYTTQIESFLTDSITFEVYDLGSIASDPTAEFHIEVKRINYE